MATVIRTDDPVRDAERWLAAEAREEAQQEDPECIYCFTPITAEQANEHCGACDDYCRAEYWQDRAEKAKRLLKPEATVARAVAALEQELGRELSVHICAHNVEGIEGPKVVRKIGTALAIGGLPEWTGLQNGHTWWSLRAGRRSAAAHEVPEWTEETEAPHAGKA